MTANNIAARATQAVRTHVKNSTENLDLTPVLVAVLLAGPLVAAALFYVWTQVTTVRLGYALSEAAQQHAELVEANRGLRIDSAALKSPDRLQRLGIEYGLAPPEPGQVIDLTRRP